MIEYEIYWPKRQVSGANQDWTKSITFSLDHAIEVIKSLDKWQQRYGRIVEVKREDIEFREYL